MTSQDQVQAASVLVTITSPDGSVESFESSPADGMLIALDGYLFGFLADDDA